MPWYNSMYDYYPESEDDELEHHGIDNQKWGVRNGPPYPLKPAVSSAVKQGKTREEIRSAKKRAKSLKKARATRAKNLKAKSKEKERVAKEEERKAKQQEKQAKTKGSSSKSPTLTYKNRDLFTTDELKEYADRFLAESKIQEISSKRLDEGKKIANNILNIGETGIRAYNMAARLYNTFSDNKSMKLPYIPGANTGESENSKGKGNNKGKDK